MSTLVTLRDLSYHTGSKTLFDNISFSLRANERVGLIGHNGSGKSTLFRLINGRESFEQGELALRRDLRLATVEQFLPEELLDNSVLEAALAPYEASDRSARSYEAERRLEGLGFTGDEFGFVVRDLSGGQQNRLMLARALANEPELILFDEPTNHLDLASLTALEVFLSRELDAAFIMVSHDRTILDAVTEHTLILRDQRLYRFDLPCTEAREALAHQDEAERRTRKSEESKIRSLEASAKRLATWGKNFDNEKFSRRAKNMSKRLDRLRADVTFVSKGSGLNLEIETEGIRSRRMLSVDQLSIYPMVEHAGRSPLFSFDQLVVRPGERIALLGANGAGKTTLIKHLVARHRAHAHAEQAINFSPQTTLGYYDQELEELDLTRTILDYLIGCLDAAAVTIRNALVQAGFAYADHGRSLVSLSGGERARVLFVKLRLEAANLLILDEPTNHVDIEGREQLEEQLLGSGATLLITSHDRRFIDRIANRFLLIENQRLVETKAPDAFYDSLFTGSGTKNRAQEHKPSAAVNADAGADQMLERLVALEQLLADDLARKPKHQKPKLQDTWRYEITKLNEALEEQ